MKEEAVETIEAGRYRIDIYRDQDASNPFEEWDGCVPIMVKGGRNFQSHDYAGASDAFTPTVNQYRRHKKALLAVFNLDKDGQYYTAPTEPEEQERELFDAIADAVKEHDYDKLEDVARIIGLPCLNTCSRGYSQGDYVDVLAVWPKAWGKENRPKATPEQIAKELQAAVDLFGAWAWGDVYGYTVTDTVTDDEVGSCWGYYGNDHKASGLMEAATAEAEHAAKSEKERHAKRLKNWIRNHVPLNVREPFAHA
jgi:hypothetical protein